MKILIITGGNSPERKISLISAKAVKDALEKVGHRVKLFDLKKSYPNLKKVLPKFDVIFPVLHGEEGEGGDLQKFLARSGKSFVGGDWRGFKKGWYKIPFKKFCDKNKIPTAPWKIIHSTRNIITFGFPCLLKASDGGSSIEVFILNSDKDLKKSIVKKLISSNRSLFVESFIGGVEVTVGILGDRALPVIEIIPPKEEWFSYKNKYSDKTRDIPFAPSIFQSLQEKIQSIALQIHRKLRLGHISRVDFIVSDNIPYALEVNTIPGMTLKSLFPKAAKAAGINFPELTNNLVRMAKND